LLTLPAHRRHGAGRATHNISCCDDVGVADHLSARALDAIVRALPATDREASPELLDVGFSSVVIAFGASVVRVGCTAQAKEGHEREVRLLPWLDGRLGVDLPIPYALIVPDPALPFGAIIQPRLSGRVMTSQDGGRDTSTAAFGRALRVLHRVERTQVPAGSIQHLDPVPYLRRIERETVSFLRGRLSSREQTRLAARLRDAEQMLPGHEQVLCHGDAWFGNVLLGDDGHVTALLDFEDACLADPAMDIAATMSLDPPGPDRVLDAYLGGHRRSSSLSTRVEAYALLRELAGLAYVLRNDIDDELEDQIGKVRAAVAR
jgi:aminoglycoside phosphotransferase (APT) family kinase protein